MCVCEIMMTIWISQYSCKSLIDIVYPLFYFFTIYFSRLDSPDHVVTNRTTATAMVT